MRLSILLALLLPAGALPAQQRLYVNQAAAGANTGQNWENAFTDLQAALQTGTAGDTIWVAAGAYRPTADLNRDSSFRLPSGVRLYGGFAGSETALGARDWNANATILSGDIGVAGDSADNSYTILYLETPDSFTVVDGFIFRHGVAVPAQPFGDPNTPRENGGALYIMGFDEYAYPIIRNCRFEQNHASYHGGAVYVNGGGDGSAAPQFLHCVFEGNTAGVDGGAIYRRGGSWAERVPDLGNCTFTGNYAGRDGGAFFFRDSERQDTLHIDSCSFGKNKAFKFGGAIALNMGRESGSLLSITSSGFDSLKANSGAAISITPISILPLNFVLYKKLFFYKNKFQNQSVIYDVTFGEENSSAKFADCTIGYHDQSQQILVMGHDASNVQVTNLWFINNTASTLFQAGFGIDTNIIRGVKFENNYCSYLIQNRVNSSTICLQQNWLIYNNILNSEEFIQYDNTQYNSIELLNVNFIQNIVSNEGLSNHNNFNFYNSLFYQNQYSPSSFFGQFDSVRLEHCYFDTLDCAALPASVICGPGNLIGLDPLFRDTAAGDYRLLPCSPLVNAGTNAALDSLGAGADLAGQPRVQGGTVDIGAFETAAPGLAAPPAAEPSCPGGASGSIALEPAGGCAPYMVAWTNGPGQTGQLLTGLPAGVYYITLTDARGSARADTVLVGTGPGPQLLPAGVPVQCGDTLGGQAAVLVQNTVPPLAYAWAGGQTDPVLTNLVPGAYALTVTDARQCTAETIVDVGTQGNLSVDISLDAIDCPGGANGSFNIMPANGLAPFQYLWDDGSTAPTLGGLPAGTYSGTLTDAFGCAVQWVLPLADPDSLQATAAVTHASDSAAADGQLVLTAITGGQGPYAATWTTGASGLAIGNLPPGDYGVTITDANGCTRALVFTVSFTSATQAPGKIAALRLWPNPARHRAWLRLSAPLDTPARLRLVDAAGRVRHTAILPPGAREWALEFAGWPAGVYTVWLEYPRGIAAGKLVLME